MRLSHFCTRPTRWHRLAALVVRQFSTLPQSPVVPIIAVSVTVQSLRQGGLCPCCVPGERISFESKNSGVPCLPMLSSTSAWSLVRWGHLRHPYRRSQEIPLLWCCPASACHHQRLISHLSRIARRQPPL